MIDRILRHAGHRLKGNWNINLPQTTQHKRFEEENNSNYYAENDLLGFAFKSTIYIMEVDILISTTEDQEIPQQTQF